MEVTPTTLTKFASIFHCPSTKSKHLNLPLELSPPRVIPVRMLRRSTMLIRRRCFKPMPFKFKLYKMNSKH
jgi:hypothetical protein